MNSRKQKKGSVKLELLASSLIPLILVGGILLIMGATMMKNGMEDEVLSGLLADAMLYRDIGMHQEAPEGDNSVEDLLKANTGVDFTWFEGDTRYATSVVKADGTRPIGTKASDEVIKEVLGSQHTFTSNNTDVAGQKYFVAYAPVIEDGKVTAMAFTGVSREWLSQESPSQPLRATSQRALWPWSS